MNLRHRLDIALPGWIDGYVGHWLNERGAMLDTTEHRMQLAIALSAENVRRKTGGPFGAIVVQEGSGRLLGVGVNLVSRLQISSAHAEILALSLAQKALNTWDLSAAVPTQLVTSCEPCAMCFGAVPWSGVRSLICGARREDAEAAGFDEGDKPVNWTGALELRGIQVRRDVLRDLAIRVLQEYALGDGMIYQPRRE